MEILSAPAQAYAGQFTSPESEVLNELNHFTNEKVGRAHMLSGQVQGNFLRIISYMIHPRRILEIGTFTGYSAICLAAGLTEDGRLHTIDSNEELKDNCRKYFEKAGLQNKIIQHTGKALDTIPLLDETFDLVFIDADKINYANYFDLVIGKVRKNGFLLADNVLFHGEVLEPEAGQSAAARAIQRFNEKIKQDDRVEQVLLTVRDGLLLMRKK